MKILGIIPARCGSKRIPKKNLINLQGKPLIQWSIESALQSKVFTDVLVSTDCDEIIQFANNFEVKALWKRRPELATDNAKSVDVVLDELINYEKNFSNVDAIMLLQPTSPFRTTTTIIKAVNIFIEHDYKTVVSVRKNKKNHFSDFKIINDELKLIHPDSEIEIRSQDSIDTFSLNGLIYLISKETLLRDKTLLPNILIPLVISNEVENLDIDDFEDLEVANYYAEKIGNS